MGNVMPKVMNDDLLMYTSIILPQNGAIIVAHKLFWFVKWPDEWAQITRPLNYFVNCCRYHQYLQPPGCVGSCHIRDTQFMRILVSICHTRGQFACQILANFRSREYWQKLGSYHAFLRARGLECNLCSF